MQGASGKKRASCKTKGQEGKRHRERSISRRLLSKTEGDPALPWGKVEKRGALWTYWKGLRGPFRIWQSCRGKRAELPMVEGEKKGKNRCSLQEESGEKKKELMWDRERKKNKCPRHKGRSRSLAHRLGTTRLC